MTKISSVSGSASTASSWRAFFDLGFRPFFTGGAFVAVLFMAIWVVLFTKGGGGYYGPRLWHGHEMLFGFALAIVAGFLLTAVKNWTGIQTLQGKSLALLVSLWALGRILPFMPVPHVLIAVIDLAFLPVFALSIGIPLIRAKNWMNYLFLPILTVFTIANICIHSQLLGFSVGTAAIGLQMAVNTMIAIMVVVGGRIIPNFTAWHFHSYKAKIWTRLEQSVPLSLLALILVDAFVLPTAMLSQVVLTIVCVIQLLRFSGWMSFKIWADPIVWVLHVGYFFIVVGFCLKVLAAFSVVSPLLSLHAFTTGGIGILCIGMMTRVSLGHTGRPLVLPKSMVVAYVCMIFAAGIRVFGPLIAPQIYLRLIHISATFWMLTFILFIVAYAKILTSPDRPRGETS